MQNAVAVKVLETQDILKNKKTVRFGLSLGPRWIVAAEHERRIRNAAVSPVDSTVVFDGVEPTDMVLSGVVIAFPWRAEQDSLDAVCPAEQFGRAFRLRHLGFVANINLSAFSSDNVTTFNRSIEGGIGLAYRINPDFGLAFTYERLAGRRPRSWVKHGEPLVIERETLLSIDEEDNRFFVPDDLSAVSLKFVYMI